MILFFGSDQKHYDFYLSRVRRSSVADGEHPKWEYAKAVLGSIVPSVKKLLTETDGMVKCDLEEFDTDCDQFKLS